MIYRNLFIFTLCAILTIGTISCRRSQKTEPSGTHGFHEIIDSRRYFPENYLEVELPEQRLEILHFHHTIECIECYLIGEALMELLTNNYQEEVNRGLITYRRINSEYLENKPILFDYAVMEEDFITHIMTEELDQITQHHYLWPMALEHSELLKPTLAEIISEYMELLN